ncbi:MAG: hypothetical protein U0132_00235 [Gemmatimonadaceae bacterium]
MKNTSIRFPTGRLRLFALVAGTLSTIGWHSPLRAQERASSPVFLLQPGMVTTDFISAPNATSSGTGFNLRFSTVLPTNHLWLAPIFGVNVIPYGTTGFSSTSTNAPSVFVGNIFTLIRERSLGGWLRVDAPLLWYYTYDGGGPRSDDLFGRDFYSELSFTVFLGEKVLRDLGPQWRRVRGYLLLDQNLTPNPDRVSTQTDRFNPIALYGISVTFGGSR